MKTEENNNVKIEQNKILKKTEKLSNDLLSKALLYSIENTKKNAEKNKNKVNQ